MEKQVKPMKILIKNTKIIKSGAGEPMTGSIAIEGSRIKYVGDVPESFNAVTVIDGGGFIAMPGLINAHTHSPMGILRNIADDLPFDDWLFGKIIPAENKLTEDDIYWGALLGICEMIKSGTTCFNDMYLHMDSIVRAVSETGIRANLSFGPITSGVRGKGLIVETGKCQAFIKNWNDNGNIKTSMEIHSVYLFDKPSLKEAAGLAKSLGVSIHIHLAESEAEIALANEKYGLSPVAAALDLGILDVPVTAAHCVRLSEHDIEILKRTNVNPVHCPSSNLKLGNGFAPVRRLLDEGLNVCLGTDGSASNNNLNMFEEMHLTSLIHKGVSGNPECIPAAAVIDMATKNGAFALGFDDVGQIAPGNAADIILIDINKPHICPVNNVKSSIVYSVQAGDVDTVIVGGEILMRGRKLLSIDEELVMSKVKEIAGKITG